MRSGNWTGKAKARTAVRASGLFRQSNDTQRQPGESRGTTCDRASRFPVILSASFHAGVGVNQSALVVIDRNAG